MKRQRDKVDTEVAGEGTRRDTEVARGKMAGETGVARQCGKRDAGAARDSVAEIPKLLRQRGWRDIEVARGNAVAREMLELLGQRGRDTEVAGGNVAGEKAGRTTWQGRCRSC